MRIAVVSSELYPFDGGGIGQFVASVAQVLSPGAEVLVLTSSMHEPEYRRLRAEGDTRLPPGEVQVEFVPEPTADEEDGYFSESHCYSARVYDRLRELYGSRGPDLVEFPDYLAEGHVAIQAATTLDPFLAHTRVCVRLHTTKEMCEVLNGCLPGDFPTRATHAMERYSLAHADRVLWQGGDILGSYRRFYGRRALSVDTRIRYPFRGASSPPGGDARPARSGPVRLLYFGRLERRKGVHRLISAATALPDDDWSLRLIGDDTLTGPLGESMRDVLELSCVGDTRIQVLDGIPRQELPAEISASDVVVLPSLWECWPYAALEALHLNRPVLATPTGGFTELVQPGQSGWLTEDATTSGVERGLRAAVDARSEIEHMLRSDGPRTVGTRLARDADLRASYAELAAAPHPRAVRGRVRRPPGRTGTGAATLRPSAPLVSAVVPYYAAHEFVREAVSSLVGQTYPRLEIILVNDGSFSPPDVIVGELAARYPITVVTQPNSGLGAARNFGVSQSRGRYVLPLDSDNAIEPGFVTRCVAVLENRTEIAYVTAWSRYVDSSGRPLDDPAGIGYQPLGNDHPVNHIANVAGDAVALIRRRMFDLGFAYSEELASYEDWHFYRALQGSGHLGAVVPERLIRHRVRAGSMLREVGLNNLPWLEDEIAAGLKEDSITWTS